MKTEIEKDCDLAQNTNKRIEKMKEEFSIFPKIKLFENTEGYDQMIAQVGIPFLSLCEHHEVSFEGEVAIGYIPSNHLIGLSKLGRIAEYYLNPTKPTIQEKATEQIVKCLEETLKPRGVMVIVKAKHGCICYRGVKKPSETITSSVTGVFRNPPKGLNPREEFLSLLKV